MNESKRNIARPGGDPLLIKSQNLAAAADKREAMLQKKSDGAMVKVNNKITRPGKAILTPLAPHEIARATAAGPLFGACELEAHLCRHMGEDERLPCIEGECPGE